MRRHIKTRSTQHSRHKIPLSPTARLLLHITQAEFCSDISVASQRRQRARGSPLRSWLSSGPPAWPQAALASGPPVILPLLLEGSDASTMLLAVTLSFTWISWSNSWLFKDFQTVFNMRYWDIFWETLENNKIWKSRGKQCFTAHFLWKATAKQCGHENTTSLHGQILIWPDYEIYGALQDSLSMFLSRVRSKGYEHRKTRMIGMDALKYIIIGPFTYSSSKESVL